MSSRNRKRFYKKYRMFICTGATFAAILVALAVVQQRKNAEELRRYQNAIELQWPGIQQLLQEAIDSFDAAASNGRVTLTQISELEDAQRSWLELKQNNRGIYFPGSDDMLSQIEKRKELHLTELLWKASIEAESKAKRYNTTSPQQPDDTIAAIASMKEALAYQERINDEFPNNKRSNYPRSANLRSWIHTLEAEPLHQKILSLQLDIEHALEQQQWADAIPLLEQAIALQTEINDGYPNAPQADVTEVARLEEKINESEAQIRLAQCLSELEKADFYLEAGKREASVEWLSNALQLQNQINLDYPRSTCFSTERAEEISRKIQLIRATELIAHIQKLNGELNLLLSTDMVDKIEYKIADLQSAFRSLDNNFPLYPNPPTDIRRKVDYLNEKYAVLPKVFERLKALKRVQKRDPSTTTFEITELIPQELFEWVMDSNPSRRQAPENPVDSISYEEVQSFCEKLSYITAWEVQVPSKANLTTITFSEQEPPVQIQKEWIQPADSFLKGKASLIESNNPNAPITAEDTFFRSRTIGFRVKISHPSHREESSSF